MAAFKKIILALAVVFVALVGAGNVAQAQIHGVITCTAFAVPPTVRVEGIAELVGDIIAQCTNSQPGTGAETFVTNVTVTLNTNVTNTIISGNTIDAVLIVNEQNGTPIAPPYPLPGANTSEPTTALYGSLLSDGRTVQWAGVTFPTPTVASTTGSPYFSGANPSPLTVRVSNIRANASQFNAGPSIASQIVALLTFTGPTTIPITNNVLNVAVPLTGLITTFSKLTTGQQCVDDSKGIAVTLQEGFPTAFKTLGTPTTAQGITQVEDGYTTSTGINGGGATQGTRFIFRFYNVPSGVTLAAASGEPGGPVTGIHHLVLERVKGTDSNGAGGTIDTSVTAISVDSTGFGFAVFEVEDDNPFAVESIEVDFVVSWTADTSHDKPAVGTMQASVAFAPLSDVFVATTSDPVPRFIDSATNKDEFAIVRCFTNLLFPYVTNLAGFDTGFAISNTSSDDKGTSGQQGACTLYFYGATTGGGAAPPSQTSIVVPAGGQIVWTLSGGNSAAGLVGAPGFQGYIFVLCQFQFAHGFAFITNGFGGTPDMAEGYLALVVPWDGTPGSRSAGNGESLAH